MNTVVRGPRHGRGELFSSTAGAVPDGSRGRARMRWPMLEPYMRENLHVRF